MKTKNISYIILIGKLSDIVSFQQEIEYRLNQGWELVGNLYFDKDNDIISRELVKKCEGI